MYFNTGKRYNKGDDIYAKNGFVKWESTKGWYSPVVEGFEQQSPKTQFWPWVAFVFTIAIVSLILWYRYKK
jgi:hypothetical protein